VDMTDISGPHAQLLTKHFDSITSGNDMKWSSVESSKGSFNFANADAEVGMAQCANMRVRGHNLVWASGQQTPSYAAGDGTNSSANQAAVSANIQEHIQNEVQHFGNKVYAWDVVNEPLDPSQPDCLLHGPFYQVLGKSYIDIALQAARTYAPAGTKLFINDYSTTDPGRLACLVRVVRDLQARGIPIDGIGHEMHNAINYPSTEAIVSAIDRVANSLPGIDQQITELDMSVYNAGDTASNYGNDIPPAVLSEQGWLYKRYFDLFRRLSRKVSAVTLWGMADDDTWLDSFPVVRTDYPLPFDQGLQAKPAYWGIVDHTKLPGFGLRFGLSVKKGPKDTQVLTVTATNGGTAGPAYTTQLNGFTLEEQKFWDERSRKWRTSCSPKLTSGSLPALLGDIAPGASASASFTVSLAGCNADSQFRLIVPWSASVYETGRFVTDLDFRDKR
jgi:endo-1,4-beta-xylanase